MSTALRRVAPVAVAIAIFLVIVTLLKLPAWDILQGLARGSIGSPSALVQSARWVTPILLLSLGAVISFRAGYFNAGGLGQYYMGAIGATWVATSWLTGPPILVIGLSIAVGIVLGALWSLIPGVLRVWWGAYEVITTIMLNFIAALLLLFLVSGPLQDPTVSSGLVTSSRLLEPQFRLGAATGFAPILIGVTVVVLVAVWLIVHKTKFGILSGIAGRNALVLEWQGANVRRLGLQAFALTGVLSGLAGSLEILGPSGHLVAGLSPEIGNTGMIVAFVGGLTVIGALFASVFFAFITAASFSLPVFVGIPAATIVVLNGLIAILVSAHFSWRRRRMLRPLPPDAVETCESKPGKFREARP